MKTEEKIEKLMNEITKEELLEMVRECISYDGSFDDLDYWENDEEFFEVMFTSKYEVARAIAYGEYNFMDAYVHLNAYGNVESVSEYEYESDVEAQKEDIIEHYLELFEDGNVSPSQDLLEKIKEAKL